MRIPRFHDIERRSVLTGMTAGLPIAALAQGGPADAGAGAVQAWDERFGGTGFRPGNSPEQNRNALAALWAHLDGVPDPVRFVSFLPGVHALRGSFSPSGNGPQANRRGGARMVLHFQGTAIEFHGAREDFNQMRLQHNNDGVWRELDAFDVETTRPYRGTWDNQGEISTLMQSPTRLKKLGVAFDLRACGDIAMYGALSLTGPGNPGSAPAKTPAVVGMGASGGQRRGQDGGMMRGSFTGRLALAQFLVGFGAFTVWGNSQEVGQNDVWTNSSFTQLELERCVHGLVCDNNHFDMAYIGHLAHRCMFPSYFNACHGSSIGGGSFILPNTSVSYVRNEKIFELYRSSLAIGNFYGRSPGRQRRIGDRAYCIFNIGHQSSLKLGCFHSDMVDPYGSGCFFIMDETDVGVACRRAMFEAGVVDKVTDRSPNEAILGVVPFEGARRHAYVVAYGEGDDGCAAVKVLPARGKKAEIASTDDYFDVYSERHGGRKIFRIAGGNLAPRKIVED